MRVFKGVMESLKLRMWDELMTLEEAFFQLNLSGAKQAVINELGKKLILQRALETHENAILNNSEQPQALLEKFCNALKLNSSNALEGFLKKTSQSRETLVEALVYEDRIRQLKQILIANEAVQQAFLQRKSSLDLILFGLIRVNSEATAKELLFRIRDDGEDFENVARQCSVGPEAKMGGVIGPKPVKELNQELKNILLNLSPGQLTEPFTLDSKQFLIARLLRLEPAKLDQKLSETIRQELFEQWLSRQLNLAQPALLPEACASSNIPGRV